MPQDIGHMFYFKTDLSGFCLLKALVCRTNFFTRLRC